MFLKVYDVVMWNKNSIGLLVNLFVKGIINV